MPRFTLKNECFPIYLLGNTIHVCWNPQNMACFSKLIDLRGHMPRFTLKMNMFPHLSALESPEMCVGTIRTGFVFMRRLIWGVTCLGLLEKLMFSCLSLWKPHKCVLKPSKQGSFFQDNRFEGSHGSVYSKKWMFPHVSLQKPHKWVLELSEQDSFFWDESIWGVTWLGFPQKNEHFPHLSPLKHS